MSINKQDLITTVERTEQRLDNEYKTVQNSAAAAADKTANAIQSKVGDVTGEINGGIESISNKLDSLKDGGVEGLLTDGMDSLKGAVSDKITSVLGSLGSKVSIEWSDPDSDGNVYPLSQSLSIEPNAAINTILSLITGLGVTSGFPQQIVAAASPAGIKGALGKLEGKVGAFASLDVVNELAQTAADIVNDAATSATNAIASTVTGTLPPGAELDYDVGDPLVPVISKPIAPTAGANFTTAGSNSFDAITNTVNAVANNVVEVSTTIDQTMSIDRDGLIKDFAGLTGKNGAIVLADVESKSAAVSFISTSITSYEKTVNAVSLSSTSGVIQGLSEKTTGSATGYLSTIAPNLTASEQDEVIRLSQGTQAEKEQASNIVGRSTGNLDTTEISSQLNRLNTTIAGTVLSANEESAFSDPFEIGNDNGDWIKGKTFTYVSTVEELEAEFKSINRDITEVIVHWTDTYTNKNIGSEEIDQIHVDLGLDGIGYHYVIRRDGSLQRGRPVGQLGIHANANDHDQYSIGLVFVGGLNCASGTEDPESFRSASSLTRSQMTTFEEFCRAFYLRYPGGQVLGHNDIDELEEDPGFDVIDYVKDLFNKESLFTNPSNQKPYSSKELITIEIPNDN